MKKQSNTQNFIITLDYDALNNAIRDGNTPDQEKLLAWNGVIYSDTSKEKYFTVLNDEILLHRWRYLKGTNDCVTLLGKVLDNIKGSLILTYFDEDGYGWDFYIWMDEHECSHKYEWDKDSEEVAKKIAEVVNSDRAAIFVEAESKLKYYKEYFTRLYDRARASKI